MHINQDVLTTVFVALTACAVLLQACILLGFLILAVKIFRFVRNIVKDIHPRVTPILETTREVVDKVAPKVDSVTTDVADMVHGWRAQSAKLESSAAEAINKMHHHTERLDDVFGGIVDAVDHAGHTVAGSVQKPARQIAGVLTSIRVMIETWMNSRPHQHDARDSYTEHDRDRFE